MTTPSRAVALCLSSVLLAVAAPPACGGASPESAFGPSRGGASSSGAGSGSGGGGSGGSSGSFNSSGSSGSSSGGGGPCTGLQCQVHACSGNGATTIRGKVFDPAGRNPLYGVVVYVPNSKPAPLPTGASCDSCDSLYTGDPITVAVTDAAGSFTLTGAPDGPNIPLVVQIGKWRRQITLPTVAQCQDNPQPPGSLRLPRNHGEGDIPNIAISTGGADTLECLLSRMGIDASEYTPGTSGSGRIHIFMGGDTSGIPNGGAGCGSPMGPGWSGPTMNGSPASSQSLWDSQSDLMRYDVVLLSCEGGEAFQQNPQALHDYASAGGRVFASHFHYSWFNTGPYAGENIATWTPGPCHVGASGNGSIVTTLPNGKAFPKGQIFQQWLENVGALQGGTLPVVAPCHNADVTASNANAQAWIDLQSGGGTPETQYLSFDTPTNAPIGEGGVPAYCGRVVFSDLHVGGASNDDPTQPVPQDCAAADLSPQEKALEFMLFDLSSCVTADTQPPPPPPPPVK
jgi:hypothetical protein